MDLSQAKQSSKKWLVRIVGGIALLAIVGVGGYVLFTIKYTYSTGEHVGFVQKLAKRGWMCKTNEGELAMVNMAGQQADLFQFTVPDDAVVKQIESYAGHRVVLEYEEHRGIPTSCFGETGYFVVGAKRTE